MAGRVEDKWYEEGLHFECRRCGRCCGGEPGYVWITETDIADFASRVGLSEEEVTKRFVRRVWRRWSLKERPNGDCVMLEDGRCKVYEVRPSQCTAFPFWHHNLKSKEDWESLSRQCPGVNRGPLISFQEIEDVLKRGL